ncbi:MAG TPA: CHRD domain-containing protein [Nitrospirales bacterium]|nr:CHRD domain-containing protein [Nitrospirales bacterium]
MAEHILFYHCDGPCMQSDDERRATMKKFKVMILTIGLVFAFSASQAWADHVAFASATGSQEVTNPGDGIETDGTCQLYLELVPMTEVKYKLQCFNITGVTQAHIHAGSAQESSAPVAFLFPLGDPTGDVKGLIKRGDDKSKGTVRAENLINSLAGMTIADLAAILRADGAYLNVHTDANGPGEVRGKISLVDTIGV